MSDLMWRSGLSQTQKVTIFRGKLVWSTRTQQESCQHLWGHPSFCFWPCELVFGENIINSVWGSGGARKVSWVKGRDRKQRRRRTTDLSRVGRRDDLRPGTAQGAFQWSIIFLLNQNCPGIFQLILHEMSSCFLSRSITDHPLVLPSHRKERRNYSPVTPKGSPSSSSYVSQVTFPVSALPRTR